MNRWNRAFIIAIFAPLAVLTPEVFAQQPQSANAVFKVPCVELIRWTDLDEAQLKVELKNVNRLSESTKQVVLTASLHPANLSEFVEAAPAIQYRLTDHSNKWIAVNCPEDRVYLKASELTWANNEAKIFVDASNTTANILLSLQLDPGTYRVNALVSNINGTGEIANVTDSFAEGRTTTVELRQPSLFGGVWRLLTSLEGLLGTAVLALLAILGGVLRDKIKFILNKLLDMMGKFFGGRLAEKRFRKRYLENLIHHHKYLNIIGLNTAGISKPLLEDVFISLKIVHRTSFDSKNSQSPDQRAAISFNTAFRSYRHMVLLGGPGAGKTTTLSYAFLMFAQDLAKQRLGIDEKLLPIYVPLRRLSNSTRSIIEDVTDKDTQILSAELLKEYPPNYFERRLKQGKCLLLLDGLDEVLDERTHRQIAGRIDDLLAAYPQNRFLVTCRTAGWKDLLSGEFTVLSAQDFDRDDIQRFVVGWHKAVITQTELSRTRLDHPDPKRFKEEWTKQLETIKALVDVKSRSLIRAINANNRILAIAVNPMLLSLISVVHLNRLNLPRGRTLLYSQCLDLLIDSWERTKDIVISGASVTASQKESVLREIAFDFQTKGREEDTRENLEQFVESIASRLEISVRASNLLKDIETRSGLLTTRSIDVFEFTHPTLREYLVAKHIQLNRTYYNRLTANFDNQRWREVILLYTGLVDDATKLIRGAASSNSADRQRLAGYCIGDAERYNSEVAQEVIDKLLNEVAKDQEEADEWVNVIAAIAADFHSEPSSVKEKLSARLIDEITDKSMPSASRALAIAAIGRGRITRGLPSILPLLYSDDDALSVAAFNAIVQFGDLALPAIQQSLNRGIGITRPAKIARALAAINTGPAARMLLTLYDRNPTYSPMLSEQMAKMIANPLVEADLLELETSELPATHRNMATDHNGWASNSAKSGFLVLDTLMRRQVTNVIDADAATPSVLRSRLSGTSFKVLFPALLTYLKSFPRAPLSKLESFEALGFDKTDPNKLDYLIDRIKSQFDMPLEFALQRLASANESHLPGTSKRDKFWNFVCNACFVLVYLIILFNGANAALFISNFNPARRTLPHLAILFLSVYFLGLVMCVVLIVVTKRKLRTPVFTKTFLSATIHPKLLSIAMNPIGAFLKVLPYVGRYRPIIKLVAFQLFVLCLTSFPLVLYVAFIDNPPRGLWANPPVIWNITVPAFFIPLSIYYWRHRVLARNPVLELVSMHPDGRKLIGDTN